jgi:hypothetical protein
MPTVYQLVVLIDFNRRHNVDVLGVPLHKRRVFGKSRI